MFYDPMLAKLCTWGETREIAINRMESSLDQFSIEGIDHNIPFLSAIIGSKRFKLGNLTTAFIDEEYPDGFKGQSPNKNEEWILSALFLVFHLSEISKDFHVEEPPIDLRLAHGIIFSEKIQQANLQVKIFDED